MEFNRLGIINWIMPVSKEQYLETATKLEAALRGINPNVKGELRLTTNQRDYFGAGSLTLITPEKLEASERRERHPLSNLTAELWLSSFKTEYYLTEKGKSYMVAITREFREPKRIVFYNQGLDEKSQKIFEEIRKTNWFKIKDNGYNKPTTFATIHALGALSPQK